MLIGWFGGERFGEAVADVLLGSREPAGRLAQTGPATGDEAAIPTAIPVEGSVHYAEGVHVEYRSWLRTGELPAYPFGHGLGYTRWELREAQVPASLRPDEDLSVPVELANIGHRPGRQVGQVYLSRPVRRGPRRPVAPRVGGGQRRARGLP